MNAHMWNIHYIDIVLYAMYSHKISIYVGIICALFNALQVSEI